MAQTGHTWREPPVFPGITFGGGLFVAVGGSGTVLVSSNGTDWLRRFPSRFLGSFGMFSDVAYGKGKFVAVGGTASTPNSGVVRWSSDGFAWTNLPALLGPSPLLGVAYGNGQFVAVAIDTVYNSSDGQNWTNQLTGVTNSLKRVQFANGTFLAVGGDLYVPGSGVILSSDNGVDWTNLVAGPLDFVNDITFGNGTYVAVGGSALSGGMILQSGSQTPGQLSARVMPGAGLEVKIVGEAGRSYQLQAASALSGVPWTNLLSFTLWSPTTGMVDAAAIQMPQRFYRLQSP